MPIISELELPSLRPHRPGLQGARYRDAMAGLARPRRVAGRESVRIHGARPRVRRVLPADQGRRVPGADDRQLFGIEDGPLHEEIVQNIININGDDHQRLRNLVNPALAPRAVDRYRPAMRRFLERLLETLPSDGRCEFIDGFAKPYPSLVIAEVMGAPLTDAPRLHHWSNWIQRQFDAASLMTERQLIEQAVAEFYEYADELIEDRRKLPRRRPDHGPDHRRGTRRPAQPRRAEQSRAQHPRRRRRHQPEPARARRAAARGPPGAVGAAARRPARLALAAVDEALRYEPITPFTARIMVDEVEHRGVTFPAGTIVLVSAWHANRDGMEPDEFDITAKRPRARVLTFGAGIHYCVGANLARAEMQEGLAFLAERVRRSSSTASPSSGRRQGSTGWTGCRSA